MVIATITHTYTQDMEMDQTNFDSEAARRGAAIFFPRQQAYKHNIRLLLLSVVDKFYKNHVTSVQKIRVLMRYARVIPDP